MGSSKFHATSSQLIGGVTVPSTKRTKAKRRRKSMSMESEWRKSAKEANIKERSDSNDVSVQSMEQIDDDGVESL